MNTTPEPVQIELRARSLDNRGNGTEWHRLIVDLETSTARVAAGVATNITGEWRQIAARAALTRHRTCKQHGEIPLGSVVIQVTNSYQAYRAISTTYWLGRVGKGDITWNVPGQLEHCSIGAFRGHRVHTILVDGETHRVHI